MSVSSGATALKSLSGGGSFSGSAGSAGISMTLRMFQLSFLPSSRCQSQMEGREILQRSDHTDEAVSLGGIMRGTKLEHELVFFAQVQRLLVAPSTLVPDVHRVTVATVQQNVRLESVLECVLGMST